MDEYDRRLVEQGAQWEREELIKEYEIAQKFYRRDVHSTNWYQSFIDHLKVRGKKIFWAYPLCGTPVDSEMVDARMGEKKLGKIEQLNKDLWLDKNSRQIDSAIITRLNELIDAVNEITSKS